MAGLFSLIKQFICKFDSICFSLMVEELAKWKSALSNRISDFQEVTKNLLTDFRRIHNTSIKTYKNLRAVLNQVVPNVVISDDNTKQKSVVDVITFNDTLCEKLGEHLKVNEFNEMSEIKGKLDGLTINEKAAEKVNNFHICDLIDIVT